jgi:hypothetical protein
VRALDERLLLGQESHSGSVGVQIAGLVLALLGVLVLVVPRKRNSPSPAPSSGTVTTTP